VTTLPVAILAVRFFAVCCGWTISHSSCD